MTTLSKVVVNPAPTIKRPGPLAFCPGCHYGLIFRLLGEVLDELQIAGKAIAVFPGGCGAFLHISMDVDTFNVAHGPGLAMATAIKRVDPSKVVFCMQGDGELGAIGVGYFISAMMRAEKLTVIYTNNACYGTTGGQMAPTTLTGTRTPTSPEGRDPSHVGMPFHGAEFAAGFWGTAYAARVSVHSPANRARAKKVLTKAFQKQLDGVGFSIVEFLSACPINWGMNPVDSVEFIDQKMIAEFPLGEFKDVDRLGIPTVKN